MRHGLHGEVVWMGADEYTFDRTCEWFYRRCSHEADQG